MLRKKATERLEHQSVYSVFSQMLDTHRKPLIVPNVKTSAFLLSTLASHLSALSALITNVPPRSIFGSAPAGVHAALKLLISCQMRVWCH